MSLDLRFMATRRVRVFDENITHNLNTMAEAAGLYGVLWRPEENGYDTAAKMIEPLRHGIKRLEDDPEHFKQFNPRNGWGDYEALLNFARKVLVHCVENPDSEPEAWR